MSKSEKQTEFFRFRLHVVIPRTYLYKLQLQFLSEESSHSPVSAVGKVRVSLPYSATEVQLCYNVQFAVSLFVQIIHYGRSLTSEVEIL